MDSFNPFANAWGDDTAASSGSPDAGPSTAAKASSFTFAREDTPPSTAATHNDDDDPLGFKSSFRPSAGVDDDEDAWGNSQPVASTSTLTSTARPDPDEWSPHLSTSNSPKHASPQTCAAEEAEDTWHQSTSSPALDASPPAWAIEDDELRESTSNHEDSRDSHTERSSEERPERQEEEGEGGFGGFAEALPDLAAVKTPPIRQDSDTDWGATELPPSRWDEHDNAPPTWQGTSPEVDNVELDAEGTNDPWRPPEARRQSQNTHTNTNEQDNTNRPINARKTSEELELNLERLKSELGIQIRNLDEEYAKQGSTNSPTISQKSPTIPPPSTGNKGSKWTIWGSKKSTTTTTTTGEGDNESSSRRGSIDAKAFSSAIPPSAISPRSSISTAGIGSSSSSPTPDITQDSTPSDSATGTSQEQQQQQAGVSRFFRFGKGRASSADPASIKNDNSMSSITTSIKPTSAAGVEKAKKTEITDDFSQLENFDSKRSTSANGIRPNSGGYDDDNRQNNGGNNNREDDGFTQRKGWFWNRNRVVDYSNEQYEEEEQDLDKVFSAFSNAPLPPPSSTSRTSLNRVPSLRSQGRSTSSSSNNTRGIVPGSKQDPFAHLSAAASSIRSSASIDPFDPLDPLAELNQASNITSRHYKDHPSPRMQTAVSSPILPPPPTSSAGMGLARPTSAISRPGSTTFQSKTTSTPPPLLAPPAPLSSVSSRKVPQPISLLDDLADLNFSNTSTSLHTTSTSSPASGNGPIIAQAPIAIKPPSMNQPSTNILEDDFGDFETFSPNISASATPQGNNTNIASPKKASDPMKLNSKQTILPKSDADFFDLL